MKNKDEKERRWNGHLQEDEKDTCNYIPIKRGCDEKAKKDSKYDNVYSKNNQYRYGQGWQATTPDTIRHMKKKLWKS